ncbi:MAG TPA: GNAT family N-acetyltransferase [Burkholderiaceae bacterium]|nr:GNAT family N-acetyltransferase [Burkholderiaceae bacterium]
MATSARCGGGHGVSISLARRNGPTMSAIRIAKIDLDDPAHVRGIVELLDHYALDPMGGGQGLAADARKRLIPELRKISHYTGALAYVGDEPVGLINCFIGFSTFAARPLLNIHDIVVRSERRGQGVARALLEWAQQQAAQLHCCKLTLEVLSNNQRALRTYERAGFRPYVLDPAAGQALLLQKFL